VTIEAVIAEAERAGVRLRMSGNGRILATGEPAAIEQWTPILRERKPEIETALASRRTEGRAALDLLNRSGARLLPHRHRTIAVPTRNDTNALRCALALLGYGNYRVVHTAADFKGQSIAVVEAALLAAGELSC
jgi:hypothetical protein